MIRALAAALTAALTLALVSLAVEHRPAAAQTATTTTLPADREDRSVIPLPNSGRAPEASGDRGGSGQLLLFGIMAAGCALIFGRVLWAGHQRSRAHAREVDPH